MKEGKDFHYIMIEKENKMYMVYHPLSLYGFVVSKWKNLLTCNPKTEIKYTSIEMPEEDRVLCFN